MTKINLKTFSQIERKSTIQRQAKEIVRKADRSLFGQMLIIAQDRQLHMKDVLSHPLGPLLWALANGDGLKGMTKRFQLYYYWFFMKELRANTLMSSLMFI